MLDYLYLGLYRFFGIILKLLPRTIIIKLMKGISWFAYTLSKKHQKIIHTNLDIAFKKELTIKEKKSYGISAFMNLLDTTFGIIERDGMQKEDVIKNVTFGNEEIVKIPRRRKKNNFHYRTPRKLGTSFSIYCHQI